MSAVFEGAMAGVNAVTSYLNNERNIAYQERENELARQREDTAYSRAVSDAKRAGLSPLAVSGTSGFSAQSMTAPQVSENPVGRGLETFNALRATQSQIDYNNALSSKAVEEAKGQSISNANAQAMYTEKLLKLMEESSKIHTENEREREFLREYRLRLEEELKGLRLGNEGKAVANLSASESREYNTKMGLNPLSSWSASATTPIGSGMVLGKSLQEQKGRDENNALADYSNKEALYKEYLEEYRAMFDRMKSDWEKSYNSMKESLKGDPNGYIRLKKWLKDNPKPVYKVPSRKDFGL